MRPYVIVLSLLICLACGEPTELTYNACEGACYTGPNGTLGYGVCRAGVPRCDDDGKMLACVGEVLPSAELCDGLDNDCSGRADDYLADTRINRRCGPDRFGACEPGNLQCIGGELRCINAVWPVEETCNNQDDDCNGVIDDIEERGLLCYSGDDPSTVANLPCRPGVVRCAAGRPYCSGEVTPSPEQCDGVDNNCNGAVDEGLGSSVQDIDVIIAFDLTGSNQYFLGREKQAVAQVITDNRANTKFRYTLIGFPHTADGDVGFMWVNSVEAAEAIQGLSYIHTNTFGLEHSLDLCVAVAQNNYGYTLRPMSRKIFVLFADEVAQTRFGITEGIARAELVAAGYEVYIFTRVGNEEGYDGVADRVFQLGEIEAMTQSIAESLLDVCL